MRNVFCFVFIALSLSCASASAAPLEIPFSPELDADATPEQKELKALCKSVLDLIPKSNPSPNKIPEKFDAVIAALDSNADLEAPLRNLVRSLSYNTASTIALYRIHFFSLLERLIDERKLNAETIRLSLEFLLILVDTVEVDEPAAAEYHQDVMTLFAHLVGHEERLTGKVLLCDDLARKQSYLRVMYDINTLIIRLDIWGREKRVAWIHSALIKVYIHVASELKTISLTQLSRQVKGSEELRALAWSTFLAYQGLSSAGLFMELDDATGTPEQKAFSSIRYREKALGRMFNPR